MGNKQLGFVDAKVSTANERTERERFLAATEACCVIESAD